MVRHTFGEGGDLFDFSGISDAKILEDSGREFKMYDYARNWVLLITSMGLIVWLTVMVFPG